MDGQAYPSLKPDCAIMNGNGDGTNSDLACFISTLKQRGIQAEHANGDTLPLEAMMHDTGAVIPAAVVSPRSEWGVCQTIKLLQEFKLYDGFTISIKSGGHGYLHRDPSSHPVILLNLGAMTNQYISNGILVLEPGCLLGRVMHTLATHHKAVPHGDCFDVGVGGHFTTAGWDLMLTRRYGLGCQSVIGGRVVLWDGSVVSVDEHSHPDLLYALRGGAAAGAGVVTEIRLRLIDEPKVTTWCNIRLNKEQVAVCVTSSLMDKTQNLPLDISPSFKFYYELDDPEPVCAFRIASLLTKEETIASLREHLGDQIVSWVADLSQWNEKPLINYRLQVASEFLATNFGMLAEASSIAMLKDPLAFWKPANAAHEMTRSFSVQTSSWVVPDCEAVLPKLYDAFESAKGHPVHNRMYALVILGAGAMSELPERCSMPLGNVLIRFESHWDNEEEHGPWCRELTSKISDIIQTKADLNVKRPFRGDIWLREQGVDAELNGILETYDRRWPKPAILNRRS
ncbi:hypothetical protein MHUMG1_03536 [Metarhizium humberi]|uniref:FAD-binding PCMH-type domain-containing protein n=1 Tax=Metarhizium humberi TaxID=2596975 RepID=A0A9P8MB98_9HYPO|nr:hypothetical protein MHUMG1_03536 [Metarhizium humberi]